MGYGVGLWVVSLTGWKQEWLQDCASFCPSDVSYFQEWWTTGLRKCFCSLSDHLKMSSLFFVYQFFYQFLVYIHLHSGPRGCFGMLSFIYHRALPYGLNRRQILQSGQTHMMWKQWL